MNLILDETAARIQLPTDSKLARDRITPAEARTSDYDEKYDFHTFCYDAFDVEGAAALVGPPLLNLEPVANINYDRIARNALLHIDRRRKVDVIHAEGWSAGRTFTVDLGGLAFNRTVGRNHRKAFAGRKVILTMFKFEPLVWLREWIEFNVRYHGADAALIYCNDLPHLTPQQVIDGLSDIDGLTTLCVVDFPFPYGPDRGLWDANFCQFGMLEHARLKYLTEASGVLVGDIDELVITSDHRSAFAILDESNEGYLFFGGKFVSTATGEEATKPVLDRRHRHYCFVSSTVAGAHPFVGTKWIIAPAKAGSAQWQTHRVSGFATQQLRTDVELRHFLHISTGWKESRPPALHQPEYDTAIAAAYRQVGWE